MKPVTLPIVNIDRVNRTAIVESSKTRFPVHIAIPRNQLSDVKIGDDAIVVKSAVTGDWLMIDYSFSNDFNYAVHNSLQTNLDDMIVDEEGVPYEF